MKRIKKVLTSEKLDKAIISLNQIYSKIPETKGCLENIKKENGCGAWCCQYQSPHVLYSEFLNSWKHILQEWDSVDIVSLIRKALGNYLSDNTTKGCIFFDFENKICKQHETRPFNCRVYGVIPEEEFKPRYERLKILYQNDITAIIKEQCNLVSTVDGSVIEKKDNDKWWEELKNIEQRLGIEEKNIVDSVDGSYLTYHDHLLLQLFPDDTLEQLTQIRLYGKIQDKQIAISQICNQLIEKINNFKAK